MGQKTQRLLVGRRAVLAGALAAVACAPRGESRVDPRRHRAFFLWAGVRAPDWLGEAEEVYVLMGEVRAGDPDGIVPLRPQPPRAVRPRLWLTLRAERLDWGEGVYARLLGELRRWEALGNRVTGLQIDFDAATRGLEGYAAFLAALRRRLPPRWRLSITGLLDWSAHGTVALGSLAGVVDEMVVQTNQGRATIPRYADYLARMERVPVPWKVGLVEGGEWREPAGLAAHPLFRGYVVFLVDRAGQQ